MAQEHTVTKVLLEWINSFSLGKTLRGTDELTDGIILWEILQDIDPQYFLDEIPERDPADHWVAKWQNLKHIHKLLLSYIRHQNDDTIPSGLDPSPDLEAVAEKASIKETNKLLKLLLIAAISSPNAGAYVQTLQSLTTPTQEGLKDIIEEAHNGQHEPLDGVDDLPEESAKADHPVDPELQFEESVGKVIAENDRLTHEKKELEKAKDDLVKAGWVCTAVARITHAYTPAKKKGEDRGPKEWKQDLVAMEKASKSLIDATKKGDPAAVKRAATELNSSCNNCHTVFRDS